ncbi:hypothetical protein WJX74_005898 [Apatococcus lobatus]|uniref:Uncharacterized protein n=1 Tax=Apatococcus lobatus TaxID=904363 RepID=A0AAW1QJ71_9CHLO
MKPYQLMLALSGLLACFTTTVVGRRDLKQVYPTCGSDNQPVDLDAYQLAFANLTAGQSLSFSCSKLFHGYSRGCVSNSVYNYIYEAIEQPPYLKGQSARPYVQVYAKPSDTALAVKQELYNLDLQSGSIFVSPPASALPSGVTYPQYTEYPVAYDAAGFPDAGGDVSGKTKAGQYAFFLNEIRSAVQNVTSAPGGDPAFACNPPQSGLPSLLQYLYAVQGIAGSKTLPLGSPLVTGPIPDRDVPQW